VHSKLSLNRSEKNARLPNWHQVSKQNQTGLLSVEPIPNPLAKRKPIVEEEASFMKTLEAQRQADAEAKKTADVAKKQAVAAAIKAREIV